MANHPNRSQAGFRYDDIPAVRANAEANIRGQVRCILRDNADPETGRHRVLNYLRNGAGKLIFAKTELRASIQRAQREAFATVLAEFN